MQRPGAPGRPPPSPHAKEGPAEHPEAPGRPPPSPPAKEGPAGSYFIDIVTILIKIRAKTCYFRSKASAAKKKKKGDRHRMLK